MTKTTIYKYLGINGIIESPIQLEGIYSVHSVLLVADKNKQLINGNQAVKSITVPESEVDNWTEVSIYTRAE